MLSVYRWTDPCVENIVRSRLDNDCPVITSTDTVLGFLARCSFKSFEALNQLKGRFEKPYLILIQNNSVAKELISNENYDRLEMVAKKLWPGPVTLIFTANASVPLYMQSANGHIALRVPSYQPLMSLLIHYKMLFSTSANKAGMPVPYTFNELDKAFIPGMSIVLDDMYGELQDMAKPSTILDCTTPTITVMREGSLSRAEIEDRLGMPLAC